MIRNEVITATSTVDGTGPLYAEAVFDDAKRVLPVTAVMTGYSGTRQQVMSTCRRLAEKGLCAVGVDMRGRDQSAGQPDSGAVEIHDIVDALVAVCDTLKDTVDAERWNILGYSGGGGNVLSAVTKFPDRFQVAVSFFGISDYAFWYRSRGRVDCNAVMDRWIGGSPDAVPKRYLARNSALAAGNCARTELHLFWDDAEIDCPGVMNETFAQNAAERGNDNVHCHLSGESDDRRWFHGYPKDHDDLIAAEDIFVPIMLERNVDLTLPRKGQLVVPGYVVTRDFSVFLGDGRQGLVEIEYDLADTSKLTLLKQEQLSEF